MGVGAHEVECDEHTQPQTRTIDEQGAGVRTPSASELERLFRGA